MEQAEVTVNELIGGLQRRGLPLPFEIGAFIALEACEQILDRPIRIDTHDIGIGDIGEVVCSVKKPSATEEQAVRALMVLLSELLVCSAPGVPAMLLELVERGPSSGEWTLDRLRDDLEASLVPLNRGATRRVLARLVREAKKAGIERKPRSSVVPAATEIDAQFDALMGLEGERLAPPGKPQPKAASPKAAVPAAQPQARPVTSASASAFAAPSSAPPRSSMTPKGIFASEGEAARTPLDASKPGEGTPQQASSLRALRTAAAVQTAAAQPATESTRASVRPPGGAAAVLDEVDERLPEHVGTDRRVRKSSDEHRVVERRSQPAESLRGGEHPSRPADGRMRLSSRDDARGRLSHAPDDLLADMPDHPPSRAPLFIGGGLALAAVVLVAAYAMLGQAGARRVLGLAPIVDGPLPEPIATAKKPTRAAGALQVNSEPSRAQVFLFIGNGPAMATDLPMGVAQEFVAMAEGYAPTRAVVPADAQWEESSGQPPQYELAMQASKLASADRTELGASLLPRDVGTPTGRAGSVRVITTPKGAKVYQLIGFTPDVRVENLPLDTGYEVMVYLPGYGLQTRRIEPTDFQDRGGQRVAELAVPLQSARAHR